MVSFPTKIINFPFPSNSYKVADMYLSFADVSLKLKVACSFAINFIWRGFPRMREAL